MTTPFTPVADNVDFYSASNINVLQDALTQAWFNVRAPNYGAVGDGSTVDTTAINAAIAAANAVTYGSGTVTRGATVYFPPGQYLTTSQLTAPQRGVRLLGASRVYGSSYWGGSTIKFSLTSATSLFDLGSTNNSNIMFEKLTFAGSTSSGTVSPSTSNHAIFATTLSGLVVLDCNFHGWGGSAVRVNGGVGVQLVNVGATGCMYAHISLGAQSGVMHLANLESYLDNASVNGNFTSKTTHGAATSGFQAGFYFAAAPVFARNSVAAFADNGWVFGSGVTSSPCFITDCRGEFNQMEGWKIAGFNGVYKDISALENSIVTDATYYGIKVTGGQNSFLSPVITQDSSSGYKQLGGIYDGQNNGDAWYRTNRYWDIRIMGLAAAAPSLVSLGNTPVMPPTYPLIQAQSKANATTSTFDAQSGDILKLTCTGAGVTLDAPTNPVKNQTITVDILNSSGAGLTITWNAVFKKAGYTDPANGKHRTCRFYYDGTNWVQIGDWSADL